MIWTIFGDEVADFSELSRRLRWDSQPRPEPVAPADERQVLAAQARRASLLGVLPGEWEEISRRSQTDRAIFLEALSAPATSGGAASSSSRG